MSKEFIEAHVNADDLNLATEQEKQLSYFLDSKLQDTRISQEYLDQWANGQYQTNDTFLNWVKLIFKQENFLSFFKYLRYPLSSTKLIKNKIEPQLRRVFKAEDADFKYDVSGVEDADFIKDLQIKKFNKDIFEKLLYNHNSLLVEDLDPIEANKPFRFFVDIKDVVSISEGRNGIDKVAFKTCVVRDGIEITGFLYIDSLSYIFYDKDFVIISEIPHDLGRTPANFISPNKFDGKFVVRESKYTYIRPDLEEYVHLKTLQKMTEPNGVIPVLSKIKTKKDKKEDIKGSEGEPPSNLMMASQRAKIHGQNQTGGTGDLQTGTVHEIEPESIRNPDGSINMDVVTNWLNFHFIPIEPLEYLKTRISDIEKSIISTMIGDVVESDEASKNQLQIEKSISVLENTLGSFAVAIDRIRTLSDTNMLGLKYGPSRVNEVFIHTGTDFFLETQSQLFEDLEKAPNALERKNIIRRISQNRYKNNIDQSARQKILYDLLPYCSDKDFEIARNTNTAGEININYQLRFNYWISQFEAQFGDIVTFWKELTADNSQKIIQINDLIIIIIQNGTAKSISPADA